jgi:hypothetical protein
MPFRFEAATLSRIRSGVISRSNCAKDKSMLRVSRPMLVVVLNAWVTEMKETPCASNSSTSGEVGKRSRQPVDLIHDDDVDLAGSDIVQQLLERRPLHRTSRKAAIVIAFSDELPSFMGLAPDVGFRPLAVVIEGIEVLFETRVGGDARVDGAAKGYLALVPFHRRRPWTA